MQRLATRALLNTAGFDRFVDSFCLARQLGVLFELCACQTRGMAHFACGLTLFRALLCCLYYNGTCDAHWDAAFWFTA